MSSTSNHNGNSDPSSPTSERGQGDLVDLARDLVEKVGIEGAVRYCHSLGWLGVLRQVEILRRGH